MARLCAALGDLRTEIDAVFPNRDRKSDGWIGDPAHSARKSDHNPNSAGVVRALDVDVNGVPAAALVEHLRKRGAAGDRRLRGGYLIFNDRIAGTHTDWQWREYTGSNPHTGHFHVSAGDTRAEYDFRGSWYVNATKNPGTGVPGHEHGTPNLKLGSGPSGPVKDLQQHLTYWRRQRGLSGIKADGEYGPSTRFVVAQFQKSYGLVADGEVGPQTWKKVHAVTKGRRA